MLSTIGPTNDPDALRNLGGRALVNELPMEVLTTVFSFNACPYLGAYNLREESKELDIWSEEALRDTVSVSHVCVRWRRIALSTRALWRHLIDPHNSYPEWTAILVERSDPLPITFLTAPYQFTRDGLTPPDFRKEMALAGRLSHSQMVLRGEDFIDRGSPEGEQMGEFLEKLDFPMLKHLAIQVQCYEFNAYFQYLPAIFPGRGTPNLCQLFMRRWFFRSQSQLEHLAETLTELSVEEPLADDVLHAPLFLDVIRSLPHLERLDIRDPYHFDRNWAINATPWSGAVLTSQLKELRIHAPLFFCSQLLSKLKLPSCRYLDINVDNFPSEIVDEDWNTMTSYLENFYHNLATMPEFRHCAFKMAPKLLVCSGFDNNFDELTGKAFNWPNMGIRGVARFQLVEKSCGDASDAASWGSCFRSIFDTFRPFFKQVQVLRLKDFVYQDMNSLRALNSYFENIRVLRKVCPSLCQDMCNLLHRDRYQYNFMPKSVFLPVLQVVDFTGILNCPMHDEGHVVELCRMLEAFRQIRAVHGQSLRRIITYDVGSSSVDNEIALLDMQMRFQDLGIEIVKRPLPSSCYCSFTDSSSSSSGYSTE